MFKLTKKKKLQEAENVEKKTIVENENVEKIENTTVNSENITESIFPKAESLLQNTQKEWKQITPEEILKKIQLESSKGNRYARFHDSYISDELVNELESQGYKLNIVASPIFVGPYFEITW